MAGRYEIAAYYFPNYHVDPRNEQLYGAGWTEWELVKHAQPRFEGHRQPRVPQWGYEDEANPKVFACKIGAAVDHGLTSFIFDWYWYNDGAFLNRCLEEGYLGADNRESLKFALMFFSTLLASLPTFCPDRRADAMRLISERCWAITRRRLAL